MNTKNIIQNRAIYNSLCTKNGVTNLTLNIGLIGSERFDMESRNRVLLPSINTVDILKIPAIVSSIITDLKDIGFIIDSYRVTQSQSEPTLVIKVNRLFAGDIYHNLNMLSDKYAQDCIAVASNINGVLIGKYNKLWGDFNPEFFIQ